LYQDLTHDNPIISSVGHFLSPKKKGVAIDAGTTSAAMRHGFQPAAWVLHGCQTKLSTRVFFTNPKEVWDNSLWDL